jgi:hypothetical protein
VDDTVGSDADTALDEDLIIRDKKHKDIYIRRAMESTRSVFGKKKLNKRVNNFYHACFYCGKIMSAISKHLRTHRKEKDVKVIDGTEDKDKRNALWDLLRNKGDHKHNMKVLQAKKGQMIIGRRSVDARLFCCL